MLRATRRAMVSGGPLAILAAGTLDGAAADGSLDLTRFGVKSSNRDNSQAFQHAFDSAATKNCPVFALPAGNYRISRPLKIRHPLTLLGAAAYDMNSARAGSVIEAGDFSAPILACGPANGERLRGFSIAGLLFNCGDRSNGVSFRRCADFALTRTGIRASAGFGMEFRNTRDAIIVDAFVSACGTPDSQTGAIDILGEPFADNSNSLHFIGARVESCRGPSLIIHSARPGTGPNNNIQFVASKFHFPAGDGSTPLTPNLSLSPAQAVSFHGAQLFDAGKGFPVVEFGSDPSVDPGYAFFGCDIDVRNGAALIGGNLEPGHQFVGCTFRTDPGAPGPKPLYRGKSDYVRRLMDLNNLYRVTP
jgi:hypothetical protein